MSPVGTWIQLEVIMLSAIARSRQINTTFSFVCSINLPPTVPIPHSHIHRHAHM